ncbi:hypothetical protein HU200_046502 [Digitaria exilis]|uniref:Uncharacterized protein n=1 Tax=Digitaria exilis TaxID=1010633 RepID=A0A835EAU6_9POAL|nr:hypothetical protein HU200_046502 [Digitaria exilis]
MSKRRGDCSSSSNEKQKAKKSHGNFDLDDSSHKEFNSLDAEIHATLQNGGMTRGYLLSVDFDYNIVCIGLGPFHVFKQASLDEPGEVGHNISVTSLCCNSTGKIVSSTGVVTEKSTELYGRKLIMSTCIIPEFGIGGPLVDSDGNFVGMNISHVDNEGSLFLPRETILESIVPYWLPGTSVVAEEIILRAIMKDKQQRDNQIERSTSEMCKSSTPVVLNSEEKKVEEVTSPEMNQKSSISPASDSESESSQDTSKLSDEPLPDNEFVKAFTNDLPSHGYPLPKKLDGGIELRKIFEEEFARDVWDRLTEEVALDTSLSVVSLASFHGETRFFACTGVLIGSHKTITRILTSASLVRFANKNEIDGSLKIRVLLPDSKHATGELQHHNLHIILLLSASGISIVVE